MKEAIAEPLQIKVPGILEGHAGDTEGVLVFLKERIQAGDIDAVLRRS
jgi:hypothetical protein